ncbi:hypothetical protein [Massilia sp. 9096]|uniref:hypothetical protein n=1 Tax=Massilia sp. 9096 TaxID=1500894 RepID=UPI001EFBCB4B|nr:hypothetical protein [Massilia sp. 9096]
MGSVQERANRSVAGSASRSLRCSWSCGSSFRWLSRTLATLSASLLASLIALPLAGCSTPQERAAHRQAEVEQMMAEYGPACSRLGYTPNTDPWRACVLQLNARDDLQRYQMSPGYYGGWHPGYWNGAGW